MRRLVRMSSCASGTGGVSQCFVAGGGLLMAGRIMFEVQEGVHLLAT